MRKGKCKNKKKWKGKETQSADYVAKQCLKIIEPNNSARPFPCPSCGIIREKK
jgi:predicted RNA-binding Zn-ribbon protein involved in translation (DUF1610 family)